ncbi:hypothetical protein O6H91_13G001800 [Diphasiastrum complanatum]|uniref:Uncharacterized protein n=1 Tax=Diphasiastrum complanatum TaxID=34168 RepID=A0ACC2BRS5_DIPCM|nr:hypothetical protein O6H91_13G001800 [Diphasiastrum complanatum]
MATLGEQKLDRLLVLFDIQTLLIYPEPSRTLSLILGFMERLLKACNDSDGKGRTLWAYKLIDSSLSPLASRSKVELLIGSFATYVRFDSTHANCRAVAFDPKNKTADHFTAFCLSLKSLVSMKAESGQLAQQAIGARAENVARALQELLTDYTWDPLLNNGSLASNQQSMQAVEFTLSNLKHPSNLIILFSPLPATRSQFSGFLSCAEPAMHSGLNDLYIQNFSSKFFPVLEKLNAKEVHTCWVGLPTILPGSENRHFASCWETLPERSAIKSFRSLGCRFMSLDSLIMGSISMPFSLLLPSICHKPFQLSKKCAGISAKLHLCIHDRESFLLEVPLCKVEATFIGTPQPLRVSTNGLKDKIEGKLVPFKGQETSICLDSNVRMNIIIRTLIPMHHVRTSGLSSSQFYLLRRHSGRKNSLVQFNGELDHNCIHKYSSSRHDCRVGETLGNDLMKMLQQDADDFEPGKPAWQILLLFISRQKSLCLDYTSSIPNDARIETSACKVGLLEKAPVRIMHSSDPDSHTEKMKEKNTCKEVQLAMVQTRVLRKRVVRASYQMDCRSKKYKLVTSGSVNLSNKEASSIKSACPSKLDNIMTNSRLLEFEAEIKRNSWQTLVLGYLGSSQIESGLVSPYKLENELSCHMMDAKTVRSINCWMKHMSKQLSYNLDMNCMKHCPHSPLLLGVQHWLKNEQQTSECLIKASAKDQIPEFTICASPVILANAPIKEETEIPAFSAELAQCFIASVEEKIANCLNAHEVDLESFAKRIVAEARQAFLVLQAGGTPRKMTSQLKKLLLQSPKKLAVKYKHYKTVTKTETSDHRVVATQYSHSEKDKVREYELQIKLRLEILSTNHCPVLQEPMKVEVVKDICRLLENIQFSLPGGIFQGESLLDFSNRVIRSSYITTLPDTVKEIYTNMEFNGYTDPSSVVDFPLQEMENSIGVSSKEALSSQGNGQSTEDSMKGTDGNSFSHSGQVHFPQTRTAVGNETRTYQNSLPRKISRNRLREMDGIIGNKLIKEAQAKRERARRLAHFECKASDLLRLRIMKPVAPAKTKLKNQESISSRQLNDSTVEVVMETPMPKEKYKNDRP